MDATTHRFTDLLRGLAAYGASEAAAKASRLLLVLAAARCLDPAAIGVAAAALAAGDILKSLSETGIVQRLIAAPEDRLEAECRTARRLAWIWCSGLFALQAMLSAALWAWTGDAATPLLLLLLAGEHLFMPGGLVPCALAMREGRMAATATVAGAQVVSSNIAGAALAFAWASPAALVLPRLLAAPIWLLGMRRIRPWRPRPEAGFAPARPFLTFGSAVLGVELVKALRMQADKLVIGALLGAEALGVYFFAFNAGLSLASSVAGAFAVALFPYLCRAENRERALGNAMTLGLGALTPLILLQAFLAPVYVPLVFGPRWAEAADLVSILCLAAAPAVIWTAAAQWLRAQARADVELRVTALLAISVIAATAAFAPHGLEAVAWAQLAAVSVIQLGAALPAARAAFHAHRQEA